MNKGILEVIAGPMFAGKTSALLKKARDFSGDVALIKPSFDTRYGICEIKTHDGVAASAFNLTNTDEVIKSLEASNAKIACFDEIQFFTEPYFAGDIVECIQILLDKGISVTCSGLDLNWKAEPFEIVSRLKAIANRYTLIPAKCAICHQDAYYTHKRGGSDSDIELGAGDIYEPRCEKHFPFAPQYEFVFSDTNVSNNEDDLAEKQGDLFEE